MSRRSALGPRRYRWPWFEALEPRLVLEGTVAYEAVSPAWFAQMVNAARESSGAVYGPLTAAAGTGSGGWQASAEAAQWIVRLTESATGRAGSVSGVQLLLDSDSVAFDVVRGLGLPGQVLVRSVASADEVYKALAGNGNVATFEPDAYVFAQQLPNDPDFPSLTSLHNVGQFGSRPGADIDAPEAWAVNTGSTNVVVGVIDSGIDVTHPDLYLNIWLNQGEIPATLKSNLTDTDGDGRITFYDLNDPANASLVTDHNGNGYIDALDLLQDPRWANGRDTDGNGFVDDLFGWNFRTAADEPFAPNNSGDVSGHGTHVAGTIGAIGNNNRGVTGINWRSSIMALKFLDDRNAGETSQAIAAINYATMMRRTLGENVRVLNASWGQSGGESPGLRAAIEAAGRTGMLFVAAAGNGNILGEGIDIDRNPFYPASYALDNILAVAGTGPHDEFAPFSNYGTTSVDLAAPGMGVLSTFPGGRYGTSNGTSMAAPHVSGAAALVWAEIPDASISEVRQAILEGADPLPALQGRVSSSARLNAHGALTANTFLPRATLIVAPDITVAGGSYQDITVEYHDNHGIDPTTLDDSDLVISHLMGAGETLTAKIESAQRLEDGKRYRVSYRLTAPGGTWVALDFGEYLISLGSNQVRQHVRLSRPGSSAWQLPSAHQRCLGAGG
jgi:subtilisin family serine protease